MAQQIFTPRPHPVSPLTSVGLFLLRLGAGGLLFFGHGYPKILRVKELASTFADPLGVGSAVSVGLVIFAEGICTLLVMIGFGTRLACIPILIFLSVAGFIQHGGDPWRQRELAFVFMVPYAALLVTGGGRYSVDAFLTRLIGRWPNR